MLRETKSYNARLFGKGIRKWFHLQRFEWASKQLLAVQGPKPLTILDFGCFDGRLATYLPEEFDFTGVDANWEGGLDEAKISFQNVRNRVFLHSENDEWSILRVDYVTSLETLEHIPEEEVHGIIKKFKNISDVVIVTVPNEIGLLFGFKYLIKWCFYSPENYSFWEYCYQILGLSHKVKRDQHKGFNHNHLIGLFQETGFELALKEGVQFNWLPYFFSPQIGLIFKSGFKKD